MEDQNIRQVSTVPTKLRQRLWLSPLLCEYLAKRMTSLQCGPKARVMSPNRLLIASRHRYSTIRDLTHFTTRSIAIIIVPSGMTTHRATAKVQRRPIRLPRALTAISSHFPPRLAAQANPVNRGMPLARARPLGVALILECDLQEKFFIR